MTTLERLCLTCHVRYPWRVGDAKLCPQCLDPNTYLLVKHDDSVTPDHLNPWRPRE